MVTFYLLHMTRTFLPNASRGFFLIEYYAIVSFFFIVFFFSFSYLDNKVFASLGNGNIMVYSRSPSA